MNRARRYWSLLRIPEWGVQFVIVAVLAVAYRAAAGLPAAPYYRCLLEVTTWSAFLLAGTYLYNSYSDRFADVGKPRAMPSAADPSTMLVLALFCLATGLILAALLAATLHVFLIALASALMGIAYSQRPLRLKERGWAGVAAAALFQRIPAFWMIVLSFPVAVMPAIFITGWLAVVGVVFILEHQLEDLDVDRDSGARTVATALGAAATRRAVARAYLMYVGISVACIGVMLTGPSNATDAILGAGIMAVGSTLLFILGRRRYARNRSWSEPVHPPALESKDMVRTATGIGGKTDA